MAVLSSDLQLVKTLVTPFARAGHPHMMSPAHFFQSLGRCGVSMGVAGLSSKSSRNSLAMRNSRYAAETVSAGRWVVVTGGSTSKVAEKDARDSRPSTGLARASKTMINRRQAVAA